jgi:hypothetical protein
MKGCKYFPRCPIEGCGEKIGNTDIERGYCGHYLKMKDMEIKIREAQRRGYGLEDVVFLSQLFNFPVYDIKKLMKEGK